jgi:hypothetical protein
MTLQKVLERAVTKERQRRSHLRDCLLTLAVIHGLVTVSTPGPVQNSYSTEQLQMQDYWNRITGIGTSIWAVITFINLNRSFLLTQKWPTSRPSDRFMRFNTSNRLAA